MVKAWQKAIQASRWEVGKGLSNQNMKVMTNKDNVQGKMMMYETWRMMNAV